MSTKGFLLFPAAMVFVTGGSVSAVATSVQTKYFSGIPSLSGSLTFNQFNNSGGTLQSIQVLFYLQSTGGELIIDNDGDSLVSGSFQFGAIGNIGSSDVDLLSSSSLPIPGQVNAYHSQAFSLDADNGDGPDNYDPTSPDGMLYSGGIESDSKSGFVGSTFWSMGTRGFLGTGSFNINYSVPQFVSCGNVEGVEYSDTRVNATGYVTVTYTYIPEPATITLLGLGLFAFRRNKK